VKLKKLTIICLECGTENEDDADFCWQCDCLFVGPILDLDMLSKDLTENPTLL